MAYNEFGIYEPRDPDLDQMRLALTKRPDLASQIPGSSVQAPKAERPLDRAELNFKNVAASLNPLMAMKTMQDVVKTAVINPLLMPASIAVEAAQGTPARQITGSRFYQAPTTPLGQVFESDLGKVAEAAKVPHMFPTAPRPAGMRPVVTPNDVRVMGAEATRMGRQVRDIPSDFANAQSGFTRTDPVTNQPTYGAKLQGLAESVGDLAQSIIKHINPSAKIISDEIRLRPEKSEVFRLFGSNEKLKNTTNWKQEFTLEQGLKETIDWFKNDSNLSKYKSNIYNI
jgi:hypothetical protein